MIRTCPKCGDYYADALLAFCLVDGTPLVNVDPLGEKWREGARVIEEKENALRKQTRKLKWRRMMMSATTMLMTTMIVCVVAVNSYIYLKPEPEESVLSKTLTKTTVPGETGELVNTSTPDEPGRTPDTAKLTATPSPSLSPSLSPSPSPSLSSSPSVSPSPSPSVSPSPSPSVSPSPSPSVSPSPSPSLDCSGDDRNLERAAIRKVIADKWQGTIKAMRDKVIGEKKQDGLPNIESIVGQIEYAIEFKECTAYVTVTYVTRTSVEPPQPERFTCEKKQDRWSCRPK
jgi:hypothetical protein